MNGRAYDYNLGRFLSVDPIIQSPGNSQSLNPYSYVLNNPLAGKDPSGYACTGSRIESMSCDQTGAKVIDYSFGSGNKQEQKVSNGINHAKVEQGVAQAADLMTLGARENTPKNSGSFEYSGSDVDQAGIGAVGALGAAAAASESALGAAIRGLLGRLMGSPVGAGVVSAIFPTQMADPADTQLNSHTYPEFDIKEFKRTQAAAISQARTADGGMVLHHGTNYKSAIAFLSGAPLEVGKALELQHEGRADLGFYLATSPFTAEHFASVQGGLKGNGGVVLSYMLTKQAISGLSASGAYFRNIQGNNSYTPGNEYYIPPNAFETFNALRASSQIQVFPAEY